MIKDIEASVEGVKSVETALSGENLYPEANGAMSDILEDGELEEEPESSGVVSSGNLIDDTKVCG